MIKYFCDFCDQQIYDKYNIRKITFVDREDDFYDNIHCYEICLTCYNKMKNLKDTLTKEKS